MNYKSTWTGLALAAGLFVHTGTASAAAIGFSGTGGFVVFGGIGDLSGTCAAGCDSGFVPFFANLADGFSITGNVRQIIQENGLGNTTSAFLRVTNITATNTNVGGPALSDNFFIVSDQFDPSLAGNAGVGLIGAYTGPGGAISYASTQAQMNYLTTGLLTQAAFGGPLTGFSLTTVSTFVTCGGCGPIGFWEGSFINPEFRS